MRAWYGIAIAVASACKGEPKAETKPAPCPTCPEADTDADYTHVDRDQLAALCVAARLPPVAVASDYGALTLADGARVPWLTIWNDATIADVHGYVTLDAKAWTQRVSADMKRTIESFDNLTSHTRSGREWKNIPCDAATASSVVITGVFFEKKSFHAFAMRGTKLLQQELPTTTPHDAVFRTAFELTEKLVGQATIATHKLGPSKDQLATVTTEQWVTATK